LFLVQVEGEREQVKGNKRGTKIKVNIKLNVNIDLEQTKALWLLLEEFLDVFVWHEGELGNYTIDEHIINTQGLRPCRMNPIILSYWEEAKVNR